MRSFARFAVTLFPLLTGGCGGDFANLVAPLGGDTAGGRGEVRVVFMNHTPYRAVCTFGTYDQTDPRSQPDFRQFGLDGGGLTLDGEDSSGVGSLDCGRVFSVGGSRLLALIQGNLPDAELLPGAMVSGAEFFQIDDEDAQAEPVSLGQAPPFEALLGVDFPCGALLILRFEPDDAGPEPFRVDFEIIVSESSR